MGLFSWQLFVVGGCVIGSASMPTGNQAVLSVLDGAHALERPSFGVGFDLTASYGTAAVSFSNGTSVTVAKITAEDAFNEVLQRLSLDSSQHLSPPYNNPGDSWTDMSRQLRRKARKAIGLPASQDVGHLAKMLSDLRNLVEEQIGKPIDSAGAATLNLVALYPEDLQDAFEYVGLRYLTFPVRYDVLYETSAAYAGYGYGLCSDYTDRNACKQEQVDMPSDVVMAVLYTRTALTVSLSVIKSAYYLYEPLDRHLLDFSLGYDARSLSTDEEDYWDAVGSKLEQILIKNPYYKRPAKVLLMGDCVRDENFQRTLKKAMGNQMAQLPEILIEDSEGIAAKGAAVFATRVPYDPYRI